MFLSCRETPEIWLRHKGHGRLIDRNIDPASGDFKGARCSLRRRRAKCGAAGISHRVILRANAAVRSCLRPLAAGAENRAAALRVLGGSKPFRNGLALLAASRRSTDQQGCRPAPALITAQHCARRSCKCYETVIIRALCDRYFIAISRPDKRNGVL